MKGDDKMISEKTFLSLIEDLRNARGTVAFGHVFARFVGNLLIEVGGDFVDFDDCLEVIDNERKLYELDTIVRDALLNAICKTICYK